MITHTIITETSTFPKGQHNNMQQETTPKGLLSHIKAAPNGVTRYEKTITKDHTTT